VAASLADRPLRQAFAAFASPSPTPGGGSACAVTSALGTALLMMAAALAGVAQHTLAGIEEQLTEAIDGDAAAYQHVMAAERQPRDTQAEQTLRASAIQLALRTATEAPLAVMRLSAAALDEARAVAAGIRPVARSDVAVAVILLRAGFDGAHRTVEANLGALTDAGYTGAVAEECRMLAERAGRAAAGAERLLRVG
jgi:methenyltetrahydrofolate cyclohydrolase